MHRSSSTTRFSDEFYKTSSSSSSSPSPALRATTTTAATTAATPSTDHDELPLYNPDSHLAKKERSRLRSAENAIHLIPVILVICAVILWSFSKPVDLVNKDDSNVPRIKDLTTMDANTDGDGSHSGMLLDLKLDVTDSGKVVHQKDKH